MERNKNSEGIPEGNDHVVPDCKCKKPVVSPEGYCKECGGIWRMKK